MKNILTLLMLLSLATAAFAQKSFEGEVTYILNTKYNNPNVDNKVLNELIGTEQHYYMKGSAYKNTFNGRANQWQIYADTSKRLYFKMSNKDTVYWVDATINKDTIRRFELHKNDTTILGYQCDKLIFYCTTGTQVYYFSPRFAIDPKLYNNAKFSNWYAYLQKSRSLALKEAFTMKLYSATLTAVKIEPKKLTDDIFELPPGIPIVQSRYK